jgi:hypothetical protein
VFLEAMAARYGMPLVEFDGPVKDGLRQFLAQVSFLLSSPRNQKQTFKRKANAIAGGVRPI